MGLLVSERLTGRLLNGITRTGSDDIKRECLDNMVMFNYVPYNISFDFFILQNCRVQKLLIPNNRIHISFIISLLSNFDQTDKFECQEAKISPEPRTLLIPHLESKFRRFWKVLGFFFLTRPSVEILKFCTK